MKQLSVPVHLFILLVYIWNVLPCLTAKLFFLHKKVVNLQKCCILGENLSQISVTSNPPAPNFNNKICFKTQHWYYCCIEKSQSTAYGGGKCKKNCSDPLTSSYFMSIG